MKVRKRILYFWRDIEVMILILDFAASTDSILGAVSRTTALIWNCLVLLSCCCDLLFNPVQRFRDIHAVVKACGHTLAIA